MASASLDYEEEFQIATFLTQVAGIDLNEYRMSGCNSSTQDVSNTQLQQTSINAQLSNGNEMYNLELSMVEGRVIFYSFDPLAYGGIPQAQVSLVESLSIAREAIDMYQECFNASYCEGFAQMIPTEAPAASTTINTQSTQLNIQSEEQSSQDNLQLQWLTNSADYRLQQLQLTLSVSKTGMLTSFTDEIAIYSLVAANSTISEEQAINTAKPYYNDYAQQNNRQIQSVHATLDHITDTGELRGNGTMMYPTWTITAEFSDPNDEGIYGYSVMVWADTGEVYNHEPQGVFVHASTGNPPYEIYLAAAGIVAAVVLVGVWRYKKRSS